MPRLRAVGFSLQVGPTRGDPCCVEVFIIAYGTSRDSGVACLGFCSVFELGFDDVRPALRRLGTLLKCFSQRGWVEQPRLVGHDGLHLLQLSLREWGVAQHGG